MKKRRYQIICFLCLLFGFTLPVQAASSVPKAVERAANSVVQVICETGVGQEEGSGFVVSKQVWEEDSKESEEDSKEEDSKEEKKMYVVTAYHLVEANKKNLTVKWKKQSVKAKAVGYFPTQNVAVLELEESLDEVNILPICEEEQKNDIDVYPAGYQYDTDALREDKGTIISKKEMVVTEGRDAISVYETNAQMSKKNVGGPTLDKNGYVIGVNFFNGNSGAIITEEELIYFLEEKNISYKTFQMNPILIFIPIGVVVVLGLLVFAVKKVRGKKRETTAYIVGVQGEYGGSQFPIQSGETIWFGRNSSDCQIVFSGNKEVSRRHCSILYDAQQQCFILTDLNSSNGTWVGEERINPGHPEILQNGDEFCIGNKNNVFRVEMMER